MIDDIETIECPTHGRSIAAVVCRHQLEVKDACVGFVENSSDADNKLCVKLLREQLLNRCNMFGYCQVASAYGSGSFLGVLNEAFPGGDADERGPRLVTSKVGGRDDVLESLRTFFKQGR